MARDQKRSDTVIAALSLAALVGAVTLLLDLRDGQTHINERVHSLERMMAAAQVQGEKRLEDHEERLRAVEEKIR